MGVAQPEPYLVLYDQSVFLVVHCAVVPKIEFNYTPLILLSSYFVFNIQFCKGCHNFSLLEVLLLGGSNAKLSTTDKNFFTFIH